MSWLLLNSALASLLAVLVLAIGRWLRPAPAVMHVLWLFVILKLVTPPLLPLPVTLPGTLPAAMPGLLGASASAELSEPTTSAAAPAIDPAVRARLLAALLAKPMPTGSELSVSAPSEPAVDTARALPFVPPVSPLPPVSPVPERAATQPLELSTLLLAAWGLGAAIMAGWYAVGLWRGHRHLSRLRPVGGGLQREVAELAAGLGVRVPLMLDDPSAPSPYIWSFGRTALCLPVTTLAAAGERGRRAVLAHELAHLRRGDHWLAHGELLLAIALYWHPLFWFARARLRAAAELAADAWAMASVPDAQFAYAAVLVDAAARPDSVPAPAVLAARPAVRAAFERRLDMILNQNVPCRASAAWWLPFAGLAMGLFATPTLAQRTPQEPVEVRVNGKAVEDLNAAERKALLRQLLAVEEARDEGVEKATRKLAKKPAAAKSKTAEDGYGLGHGEGHGAGHASGHGEGHGEGHSDEAPATKKKQLRIARGRGNDEPASVPEGSEIRAEIMKGLAEARAEIAADEDLRELGITDEVMALIDSVGNGEGLEGSLDGVVRAAMGGIGKKIRTEIAADDDLRELGLDQGIMKLVTDFLGNERNQEMISDFVMSAAGKAMREAKAEIRADVDLERLGLTADVEGLLDSLMKGGAPFDQQLQKLLDKSLRAAGREMDEAMRNVDIDVDVEREVKAKPRKKGLRIKFGDDAVVR